MNRQITKHMGANITKTLVLTYFVSVLAIFAQPDPHWKIHDSTRPKPVKVDPGYPGFNENPGKAPSDAVVLFDGSDLSKWVSMDGNPPKWIVKDGHMECVQGSGYIRTLQCFGDCQLHVEWAAPVPPRGSSQGRGNSGVFLMGLYEVQVLDNFNNETYSDGYAGAIYCQHPPLVNACREPGKWQTYDIIFTRPRFDMQGNLVTPAKMTVLHNGVLVQHESVLSGPTGWLRREPYRAHPDKLPISLQDHGNPVLFRNIWVRELGEDAKQPEFLYPESLLKKYAGEYGENGKIYILQKGDRLFLGMFDSRIENAFSLFAASPVDFFVKSVDIRVKFQTNSAGGVDGITWWVSSDQNSAKKTK